MLCTASIVSHCLSVICVVGQHKNSCIVYTECQSSTGGIQNTDSYGMTTQGRTYLVNHAVPGKPSIVNDNMDLATAKLGRLLHQRLDVTSVQDIADDGECAARLDGVDSVSNGVRLLYGCISVELDRVNYRNPPHLLM